MLEKRNIILVLCAVFAFVLGASAQIQNKILVWGSGGYGSIFTDAAEISASGGIGFGGGIGYEFQAKRFIINTGAEFINLRANLKLDDFYHRRQMSDTENDEYIGHFYFSNSKDQYKLGYLNIPLMLGVQSGRFYVLGGAKIGLNMFTNSKVECMVKSTSTYPAFMEDFEDMPNHFFTTVSENEKYQVTFDTNVSAAFEAGFYFRNTSESFNCRLSAFCDYGLKNINNNSSGQNLIISKYGSEHFRPVLNDFLLSHQTKANTLYAGLKLTLVFGLKKQENCNCEKDIKIKRKSSRGLLWGQY